MPITASPSARPSLPCALNASMQRSSHSGPPQKPSTGPTLRGPTNCKPAVFQTQFQRTIPTPSPNKRSQQTHLVLLLLFLALLLLSLLGSGVPAARRTTSGAPANWGAATPWAPQNPVKSQHGTTQPAHQQPRIPQAMGHVSTSPVNAINPPPGTVGRAIKSMRRLRVRGTTPPPAHRCRRCISSRRWTSSRTAARRARASMAPPSLPPPWSAS